MIVWLLGVGVSAAAAAEPALKRFEFTKRRWRYQSELYYMPRTMQPPRRPPEAAFSRFHQLNAILSDYDPQSELRRLCDTSSEGQAVRVSDDLWRVLVRALELSERSDGAFDVTIGPVVHLWRSARRTKELPSPESLQSGPVAGRLPVGSARPGAAHGGTAQAEHAFGPRRNRQGIRRRRGDGRARQARHHPDDGRGRRQHRPGRPAAGEAGLADRHRPARRATARRASTSGFPVARSRPPATCGNMPSSAARVTRT